MIRATPGTSCVQLVERDARERDVIQLLLQSCGLGVEVFSSLAERTERAPGPAQCLLCSVDGAGSRWREFDDLLAEIGEGTPVVLVGRAPPLELVVRALKAGAIDVLRKPIDRHELNRAVKESIERSEAERLRRARILELRQRVERLTARELEVFDRLITGRLNKQVGAELGITERTVKAHRASILRKVSVGSVAELVRVATTLEFARQQMLERASMASKQILESTQDETEAGPISAA